MNAIALNPFITGGVQQSTVINANKSPEYKELTIVGNVLPNLTAAQDAYIDIYLNVRAPRNRRRIMTKNGTVEALTTINIEQADTYIIECLNFNGYLLGDFGVNQNSLITSTRFGNQNLVAPNLNSIQTIYPQRHTESWPGDLYEMGPVNGKLCVAIVNFTGNIITDPTSFSVFESDEGLNETPVIFVEPFNSNGYTLTNMTQGLIGAFTCVFQRTKTHIRTALTMGNNMGDSLGFAAAVIELPR